MSKLQKNINQIEDKWLEKLFTYTRILFSKSNITSHDHLHHKRVWNYCKEILNALESEILIEKDLIESLIIATFFHDTGLTITVNENHGFKSRMLCENYFNENNIEKPVNFEQILDAIEKHDNKNYTEKQSPTSLLTILCTADDMDAFGRIGVIRYSEIYLLRGLPLHKLPDTVIENIDKRFGNFKQNYQFLPDLFTKYKSEYLITREFYEELKKELS
ncbi:MAG: hypothetical protein A2X13_00330 [Bacteroidetes bacterium GWC2_33_15]|nr:MAG: hypothetical protein A2X10_04140 [Bacteroidetes bacterium GWA2_33_15]OFX51072.1 MAG: hypothetical protein A2X13_00330 [Bacteroidetes bacterium GWC2_33_15]OFX66495.1 MAG: hypothetical protein A2X15_07625 [Bacteroidetes bacterium GWB2_32_14]OFX70280.1 MAG: hypothetical protein A2X14_03220 [Bacteroidetes bacterium GWD2_33_33]HAN17277.1 hypothetical protein [Bacteroidales bacterium]